MNPWEQNWSTPPLASGAEPMPWDVDWARPPKPNETGDTSRGFHVAIGQTVPILRGVVGLAGATAENVLGEGGISTGVKNWGLRGFTEGMEKLQPMQKDTDELTTAWSRAKDGDLGALIDWAQYGLGYAAGQGGEAVAMSLLGGLAGAAAAPEAAPVTAATGAITGLVAKGAVKEAATALIRKAVVKEANGLMAESAGKITAEQAVQQATKSVAKEIGSTSALLTYGGAQELGSIYPEAEAEALKKGEALSGSDIARVWATGLAAGGLEGLTDKLGIGALTGKVKIPGATTRLGNAALQGLGGAAVEGGTEAAQTAIERFGAGQEVLSPEGQRDIINSAGLGALGGGAIGGGLGAFHSPERARSDEAFHRIASAETPDDAIKAFEDTYIPPVMPSGLDAEGALARLERENQRTEKGMRDFSEQRPTRLAPAAELPAEFRPKETDEPSADFVPDEPFGDRLITVREHLADSRTRQQIRDVLGPEALNDAMYYAQAADNHRLPGITSDRMLQLAETIVSRAVLQPIPNRTSQLQIGQQAPIEPGPTVESIATPPESVIEVSPEGVATPQVRAGVMVDRGRFVPPEAPAAVEPLALPEPEPYRKPATLAERAAAFDRAEQDRKNAKSSQLEAIPGQVSDQQAAAAAVQRAATVEAPTAMQAALEQSGLVRAKSSNGRQAPTGVRRLAPGQGAMQQPEGSTLLDPQRRNAERSSVGGEAGNQGQNTSRAPTQGRSDEDSVDARLASQDLNDNPSDPQKDANNYKHAHVRISGMDVSIENRKGDIRRSKAGAPKPWQVKMPAHYGYIRGTKGADGDHVDLFIGDKGDNGRFWVVNQTHPDTNRLDEHKIVTGVDSAQEAQQLYESSFEPGFAPRVFGSISPEMSAATLKARLPKMAKPIPVGTMPPKKLTTPLKERAEAMAARSAQAPQTAMPNIAAAAVPSPAPSQANAPAQPASSTTGERDENRNEEEGRRQALLNQPAGAAAAASADRRTDARGPDRRADQEKRKRVADMTPDEMRSALHIDDLTGLRNGRWMKDHGAEYSHVAAFDADSLKWVNDNMGHESGDMLLKAWGEALSIAAPDTSVRAGGDEFFALANSEQEAKAIAAKVDEILSQAVITAETKTGEIIEIRGIGASYGVGTNKKEADERLNDHKDARQAAGERAARGEEPPGTTRTPAAGKQDQVDQTAREGDRAEDAQVDEPYAAYDGKTITQKVDIADTGKTATMRMDAGKALRALDDREKSLNGLLDCLKGRQ